MDELIIGEKKYISSKQAAKATGYAKDYIGQLCREGRVPARLVGRSWYVLESAIHDHRFSDPKETSVSRKNKKNTDEMTTETPSSVWESPRYETSDGEILPSVNRLREENEQGENPEIAQRLQASWKAWFDRFDTVAAGADTSGSITDDTVLSEEPEQEKAMQQEETLIEEDTGVQIPIHAIYHPQYQPLPTTEEPVLQRQVGRDEEEFDTEQGTTLSKGAKRSQKALRTVQIVGALFALLMSITAALGSGYLDKYILSSSTVRIIAGVALYNK